MRIIWMRVKKEEDRGVGKWKNENFKKLVWNLCYQADQWKWAFSNMAVVKSRLLSIVECPTRKYVYDTNNNILLESNII